MSICLLPPRIVSLPLCLAGHGERVHFSSSLCSWPFTPIFSTAELWNSALTPLRTLAFTSNSPGHFHHTTLRGVEIQGRFHSSLCFSFDTTLISLRVRGGVRMSMQVCVYVCVLHVRVWVHMNVCEHACANQRSTSAVVPQALSPLFLRLAWHSSGRLGWLSRVP